MNYLTVISEIITLPLLLFRPTRKLGLFLFFSMFLLLTFVFRIDAIGPSGLVIGIGILSITFNNESLVAEQSQPKLGLALIGFLLFSFFNLTLIELSRNAFSYPRVYYPFKKNGFEERDLSYVRKYTVPLINHPIPGRYNLFRGWYAPFNMHHFIGRYAFKLAYIDANGNETEISVFKDDGLTKFGILEPRTIQDKLTTIQFFSNKYFFCDDNEERVPKIIELLMKRFGQYGEKLSNKNYLEMRLFL